MAFVACRPDSPVAPASEAGPDVLRPSFSFTGGSGEILGSTQGGDQGGELVRIDLDAGTVTLIGHAGSFEWDWTDVASDDAGRLYALSRRNSETDRMAHLYEIDPSTGAVISEIGTAGQMNLSDFDFNGTAFLGNGRNSSDPAGRLFTIDETTAQVTWITQDSLVGFGLNPYDTIDQPDPIRTGGFAVHPTTGELWGIENLSSDARLLFRIDPSAGVADTVMPLGLNGVPIEEGSPVAFDGLHILDDGTFLATRGGALTTPDSTLWEISPSLDPISGLAEIAVVPLTFDPAIEGRLTGMEAFLGSPQDSTVTLQLTADTTELHPWVDSANFEPPGDTLYTQLERVGDTTTVTISTMIGNAPAGGVSVTVTGELIPGGGGHSHYQDSLPLGSPPDFLYSASPPQPVAGYLKDGTTRSDTITVTTDTLGIATFAFVAGFLGGRINVIADATVGGAVVADTVTISIRVPGLVDVVTLGSLKDSVHFIGPKEPHQSDSIWYATSTFSDTLRAFVALLADPSESQFVGVNDMSLPWGGSFTLESLLYEVSTNNQVDRPNFSHHFHATGVDADIAPCFFSSSGKQAGFENPSCSAEELTFDRVEDATKALGLFFVTEGDHFHIRLGSELVRTEMNDE